MVVFQTRITCTTHALDETTTEVDSDFPLISSFSYGKGGKMQGTVALKNPDAMLSYTRIRYTALHIHSRNARLI